MSNINHPLRIQTQHRRICRLPMNGSNRFYQDQTSLDMLPLTVVTVAVAVWDQLRPHLWLRVFALQDSIHKVHQIYLVSLNCFAEFKSKVEITQNFVASSKYTNCGTLHILILTTKMKKIQLYEMDFIQTTDSLHNLLSIFQFLCVHLQTYYYGIRVYQRNILQ